GAGGDGGSARVPSTQVGTRQDLSLSHSPWRDLSAVSGAVCVALPLSAGGIGDGCSRPRGCGRARFHVVRGGGSGAVGTDGCCRECSHYLFLPDKCPDDLRFQLDARRRRTNV